MRMLPLFVAVAGLTLAAAGESRHAPSRVVASRLRYLVVRGGTEDPESAPMPDTAATASETPTGDGGLLSSALAMLADGSMLAQLQTAAATNPAARARIAELLAQPSVRASLRAAGFISDGASVEQVLARMAEPETVERMRALAKDPTFREKLSAAHTSARAAAPLAAEPEAKVAADSGMPAGGTDSETLLRKVRAVRARQATALSPAEVMSLQAGAAILARHEAEGGGVWLSATVVGAPRMLAEGEPVCDVRYADGEEERAVPASRLAVRAAAAEIDAGSADEGISAPRDVVADDFASSLAGVAANDEALPAASAEAPSQPDSAHEVRARPSVRRRRILLIE